MDRFSKLTFIFIFSLGLFGCGVKGVPLPPLNPAPLGRGEPVFKEATEKKTYKKQNLNNQENDESPSVETDER